MIGYLRGTALSVESGQVILGVGSETSGWTGYEVQVPAGGGYHKVLPGKPVELFIYTHVREDALDLFGFFSPDEKELFLTLLSVSGIGPKSALTILSNAEPCALIQMIESGDSAALTRIPGIGKKTAERMVVELGDLLRKKRQGGAFQEITRAGGASALSNPVFQEARAALISLGYAEQSAARVLNQVLETEIPDPVTVEKVVKLALKQKVM